VPPQPVHFLAVGYWSDGICPDQAELFLFRSDPAERAEQLGGAQPPHLPLGHWYGAC
jgi:hypothetical protein